MDRSKNSRIVRSPRGTELSAKDWLTEAPLRMLMNNLDPEVAENPNELVVYGGIGRAARNWEAFDQIAKSLQRAQYTTRRCWCSPASRSACSSTHADAPRVLIANSNLVPRWATWEHFNELDRKGLMMYGQMTAGSWIYIGSQGIVQGTYETFVEAGRQHYNGDLSGRWILTGGLGGMGGAQTLAATMAGASCLAVECQPSRIEMRLNEPLSRRAGERSRRRAGDHRGGQQGEEADLRRRCSATPPRSSSRLVRRGVRPDIVTDQTSAHDPVNGYLPKGWTLAEWGSQARRRSAEPSRRPRATRWRACPRHAGLPQDGRADGRLRQQHPPDGEGRRRRQRVRLPGFVPAYIRPLFCRGNGPFRWAALSGDPEDIYKTDAKVKEILGHNKALVNWLDMARERIQFQGLPARICWVGLGDRHRLGLAFNEMVAHRASSRRRS